MTKEEAIKLIDTHTVCFYNEIDSPTLQALHMAIEALSADTVSREHHDMEIKELKHQIKDQAVQVWIPCSERLPEKTGWYVVTVEGFETITDMLVFYKEVSAWSDITDKQKVVAWMPLPTPYKGGDE